MLVVLVFLLLLILFTDFFKEGGGENMHLVDIVENKLVLEKSPATFTKNKILSYPYVKYNFSIDKIKSLYNDLKEDKMEVVGNEYYDTEPYKYQFIVDYFQENARLLCSRINIKITGLELFNKNIKTIETYIKKNKLAFNYENIMNGIYTKLLFCSEFNPLWLVGVIKHYRKKGFKIENLLDMSAGRGSRMLACAATNTDYFGIDPCEATHENYGLMMKYFRYCGAQNSMKIIKSGFETNWDETDLPEFDIMFSSPPYFNLEIYEDNPTQSISKYNDVNSWVEGFMRISMEKILRLLRPGGLMMINIDKPLNIEMDYITPLLQMKFDNAQYLEPLTFNRKGRKFHAWVWQKNI